MLCLKDSTGVNWREELPDNSANPGGRLQIIHLVDSKILVLVGSRMKSSQLSIAIVLGSNSLASEEKVPLTFR